MRKTGLYLRLSGTPEDCRLVREQLRSLLQRVGAGQDVIFDVLVAFGEASGNAIRHAVEPSQAGFEVKAKTVHGRLVVMVRDYGRWRAERRSRDDPGGMGFALMR